jgi:hypothetical protein
MDDNPSFQIAMYVDGKTFVTGPLSENGNRRFQVRQNEACGAI